MKPRTATHLIDEMRAEASKIQCGCIAIIVEFDYRDYQDASFVFANEVDPLTHLKQLMQRGGKPIGLAALQNLPAFGRIPIQVWAVRAFREYEKNPDVEASLKKVCASLSDPAIGVAAMHAAMSGVPTRS